MQQISRRIVNSAKGQRKTVTLYLALTLSIFSTMLLACVVHLAQGRSDDMCIWVDKYNDCLVSQKEKRRTRFVTAALRTAPPTSCG